MSDPLIFLCELAQLFIQLKTISHVTYQILLVAHPHRFTVQLLQSLFQVALVPHNSVLIIFLDHKLALLLMDYRLQLLQLVNRLFFRVLLVVELGFERLDFGV